MKTNHRKAIRAILIIYTAIILFFLFFSFGRIGLAASSHHYRFNLMPRNIYIRFPVISGVRSFGLWFFNIGNFVGFIPFGILIPILYPCKFTRFILLFVPSILLVETVQMLTFLGSFDIDDIIINTIGAAVGFAAYKIGFYFTNAWQRGVAMIMALMTLSIGLMGLSELAHKSLTKIEGPPVALSRLPIKSGGHPEPKPQAFEIAGEKIQPRINLYSSQGNEPQSFTYALGGKDIILLLNYGITDKLSGHESKVVILADGEEVEQIFIDTSYGYPGPMSSEINIGKVDELTITIKGNIKLWDITVKEMKYYWQPQAFSIIQREKISVYSNDLT